MATILVLTLSGAAVADEAPNPSLVRLDTVHAVDSGGQLPLPAALRPDVQFWIRVYTEVSNDEGLLHDQHRLSVIYKTMHFAPGIAPKDRQQQVEAERTRVQEILRRLAAGGTPQDAEELHIKALWGNDATPAQLQQAALDLRFQLGQSDRFREGLARAGSWQGRLRREFVAHGLPAELALLPHVESSFDPSAWSKVGAAGMWQFMRSTGALFLRIDNQVDERFDPLLESRAAANLLLRNYQLLGTWPLAITAYNHGSDGMRRARDELGPDIVRIVRDYHSPTFGFASRNFYVSFLAAVHVAENAAQYFGNIPVNPPLEYAEVAVPRLVPAEQLARVLDVDLSILRALNPSLRPPVWSGALPVPGGFALRVPRDHALTAALLDQKLMSDMESTPARSRSSAAPSDRHSINTTL